MAYTEVELTAMITALETALTRHEQTVQFKDRSVTFSSTEQIVARIDYFKGQLRALTTSRRKQIFLTSSKGL